MKAYPIELRERIVESVDKKEGTLKEIAKRYKVSKSFIDKLIQQRKEQGHINPLPHGGGEAPLIDEEKEVLIGNYVLANNDATLEELCDYLEKKTKLRVSITTMHRALEKLNLPRKKNSL